MLQKNQEGSVLMIVVLILLVLTATATYTVYATTSELQGTAATRKIFQTEQISKNMLEGSISWAETNGPAITYRHITYNNSLNNISLEHLEQLNLAPGQLGARFYSSDIENNNSSVYIINNESFNNVVPYSATGILDIYDVYLYTGNVAGSRADGYGNFKFLKATYTTRINVSLNNSNSLNSLIRDRHTSSAQSRAVIISGPFNL